jgi:enoyl-CoA hydratase
MDDLTTLTYESGDRVARITLDRPERGNGIVPRMPAEIAACVERANLDPAVHAIALAGNGSGFCGGYDLVASAERMSEAAGGGGTGQPSGGTGQPGGAAPPPGRAPTDPPPGPRRSGSPTDPSDSPPPDPTTDPFAPPPPGRTTDPSNPPPPGAPTDPFAPPPPGAPTDPATIAANHAPESNWDPVTDFQFMWRNVRGFMSLFHSEKPVLCKVHGYCVAGGTDMALCSDLLVVADDAKIGYPPARVWGSPTTALWAARVGPMRAKRLLLTGDSLSGEQAVEWGLATEAAPAAELDERFEALLERVARLPINQLVMMKMLVNQSLYAQGLHQTQLLGTFFDGVARHTEEGHEFVRRAAEGGFKQAVRERDEPFGDHGLGGFGVP